MQRPLNLSDDQRQGCNVTFNVNRFEVYAAAGWMMFAAGTKAELKANLKANGIVNPMFDSIATRKYMQG